MRKDPLANISIPYESIFRLKTIKQSYITGTLAGRGGTIGTLLHEFNVTLIIRLGRYSTNGKI